MHHTHRAWPHRPLQAPAVRLGGQIVRPHVVASCTAVVIRVRGAVPASVFARQPILHRVHDDVCVHGAPVAKVLEQHPRDERLQKRGGRGRVVRTSVGRLGFSGVQRVLFVFMRLQRVLACVGCFLCAFHVCRACFMCVRARVFMCVHLRDRSLRKRHATRMSVFSTHRQHNRCLARWMSNAKKKKTFTCNTRFKH